MASGTPVVATTAGALPEVAGDAAVLVEPGNPVALAGGIERAIADHERLRAAGLARAARYSWAETARLTLEAYRELLGEDVAAVVIWTPGDPDPGPCLDSLAPQVDELVLTVNPGGSPVDPRGRR